MFDSIQADTLNDQPMGARNRSWLIAAANGSEADCDGGAPRFLIGATYLLLTHWNISIL
jgi:hypothetical protein